MCKNCTYLEFFWSVFSRNAGKQGLEKLQIRTLFTQCIFPLQMRVIDKELPFPIHQQHFWLYQAHWFYETVFYLL